MLRIFFIWAVYFFASVWAMDVNTLGAREVSWPTHPPGKITRILKCKEVFKKRVVWHDGYGRGVSWLSLPILKNDSIKQHKTYCMKNAVETNLIINQFLNRKWSLRGSLPNLSMTFCMNDFLCEFIWLLRTLIKHSPDNRSSDMVVLSHVLTLLNVLNDLSTVQVVAGRISKVINAWRTTG